MADYTLSSKDRLKSRKVIEGLFKDGKSLVIPPLRILYTITPMDNPDARSEVRMAFSASKRKFKKAVDRNLIKRRMREAYRHHKLEVHPETQGISVNAMLMYIYNDIKTYQEIEKAMELIIRKMGKKISVKPSN